MPNWPTRLLVTPSNIFWIAYLTGRDLLDLAKELEAHSLGGMVYALDIEQSPVDITRMRKNYLDAEQAIANARRAINNPSTIGYPHANQSNRREH